MIEDSKQGTQTATRSLRVLWLLADAQRPLLLREIVETLGITKGAAHRLLGEFARQSLVTRTADNRYAIGPAMVALAARILEDEPLRAVARPLLEALGRRTSETVSLHLLCGDERVCVDSFDSPHAIRRVIPLGQTVPLYLGSTSKAILAFLPLARQEKILLHAQVNGRDPDAIRAQLRSMQGLGYLATVGDRIEGVSGLSFALIRAGEPVAAVTISGPADRWSQEDMEAAVPIIRQDCETIRPGLTSLDPNRGALAGSLTEVGARA